MNTYVLDLDGSLLDQPPVARRLADGRAQLLPLRSRGPQLRLWATRRAYDSFDTYWRTLRRRPGPALMLLGSGDFHHLTASFVAAAAGPLTVVHFDNHPDWCRTTPRRHCGSWVSEVLAMDHVRRVVTLGPCSDDLQRPDRKTDSLPALFDGRLEIHPWRQAPSQVRGIVRSGAGHAAEDNLIRWRNLADVHWSEFLDSLLNRLPTDRVWITIDKDVLPSREAVTNWDQGGLPLGHVLEAIRRLAAGFEIVGADICGEYAPIQHRNLLKFIEARLDQPRGMDDTALQVNARTNERLIAAFETALNR